KIVGRPRGCAFMVNMKHVKKIGLLDERFFIYTEETDWALRFHHAGFDNFVVKDAHILHHWAKTTSSQPTLFDLIHTSSYYKYFRKHFGLSGWLRIRMGFLFGALLNICLLIFSWMPIKRV